MMKYTAGLDATDKMHVFSPDLSDKFSEVTNRAETNCWQLIKYEGQRFSWLWNKNSPAGKGGADCNHFICCQVAAS